MAKRDLREKMLTPSSCQLTIRAYNDMKKSFAGRHVEPFRAVQWRLFSVSLGISLLLFSGCGKQNIAAMPPPKVGVTAVVCQDFLWRVEFPAKICGSREVQVRAQVGGILKERIYEEGQFVEKGQTLFLIDPQSYEIALRKAEGALALAKTELFRCERDFKRMENLARDNAISQKDFDNALSAFETAKARYTVAEEGLNEAEVNLNYTRVEAPIDGIVRKEQQSVGNLISPGGASGLLTQMTQTQSLHLTFSVPCRLWERMDAHFHRQPAPSNRADLTVEIILSDGNLSPEKGRIFFIDSNQDDLTSAVSMKAEVANSQGASGLMPGQLVRVRLLGRIYPQALLIPECAAIQTPAGTMVMVLDGENCVSIRPVQLETIGNVARVLSGLKSGDRVISEGIVKARPGNRVTPVDRPLVF